MKPVTTLRNKITDDLMACPDETRQNEIGDLVVSLLEFAAINAAHEAKTETALSLFELADDVRERFPGVISPIKIKGPKSTEAQTPLNPAP